MFWKTYYRILNNMTYYTSFWTFISFLVSVLIKGYSFLKMSMIAFLIIILVLTSVIKEELKK